MESAGGRIGGSAREQSEEAVPLFIAGQAWAPAIRLIVTQAQALLALERWQTVHHWIESLPEAIRTTTPWLRFWLGMCRLRVDPAKARLDLEPAFALFQQGDDALGQALAATAINEAHMVEWVDYRRLDPWIAALEAILKRHDVALPSLNTELAVRASLFTAIVLRQTYREDIPHLARHNFGAAPPVVRLGNEVLTVKSYAPSQAVVGLPPGIRPATYRLTVTTDGPHRLTSEAFSAMIDR